MMRTGRILVVEPRDDFRRDLDRRLDLAGHDVAAVPDESQAVRLLEEGLDPDVVVVEEGGPDGTDLRRLAPRAALLRIDRALDSAREFEGPTEDPARCAADAEDVLRRVEEILLRPHPHSGTDPGSRCLDLARRLANALPRTRSAEQRIGLVTEAFDAFFGVCGTLVIRRGLGSGSWIEASQHTSSELAARIGDEIVQRARTRDIRPFLTRLSVGGETHEVACLAVTIAGSEEIDLALVLERAPSQPGQRESLMNLVGSAVRASAAVEELDRARSLVEIHGSILDTLLDATRELTAIPSRAELKPRFLSILRRELSLTQVALAEPRADGTLELTTAIGFSREGTELADLPRPATGEVLPLAGVGGGALERAGLRWAATIALDGDRAGVVLGGRADEDAELAGWERRLLLGLLGAAGIAIRNLGRLDELGALSAGSLRELVAATELAHPWERGHAERVARTAIRLGRAAGMPERKLRDLSLAAMLHDVGKVGTDPAADDAGRMHPVVGSTILSRGRHSADVIHGVEQHHERFDGEGFPYGLSGEAIHPFGRILAIADAWDRMTRACESPITPEEALGRLERGAGLLWDPGLVTLFADEIGRQPALDSGSPSAVWLQPLVGPGA